MKKIYNLIFFLIVLILFIINATYVSYPDEFVNLWGARFINEGKIPYKDFFDHHLPFAWYFVAILLKFSFGSFVLFRIFWAVFQFLALAGVAVWIKKHHKSFYWYYSIFFLLYPLISVYFWLHLYLADSLSTLYFSIIFWVLIVQTLEKKTEFKSLLVSSLLTFCLLFSSLTFIYIAIILYFWQLYLIGLQKRKILVFILVSLFPYAVYALYLLLTDSLSDFYFANFVYNTKHYISISNYTPGKFFNPLKFAFTLIYNFWSGFLPRLATIRDFNLYLPIGELAALGSLTLVILLVIRNPIFGAMYFFILSFSAPRSNIQTIKEADYQIGLYIMLGLISALIALFLTRHSGESRVAGRLQNRFWTSQNDIGNNVLLNDLKRLVQLVLVIYLFSSSIFLLKNTYDKWYLRYTQKMPSIYNRSDTAQFLDEILNRGDYYWSGPYEPHEVFFVSQGRLPGKYITLLPQFKENELLKKTFIEQFQKNPPKVIIFKKNTGVYLTPAYQFGDFFLDWMKDKYVSLEAIQDTKILKSPSSFDIEKDLYLLNNDRNTLIKRLKEKNYVQ